MTDSAPTTSDSKLWAILCHLSLFIGFFIIIPLIIFFVKKSDDPFTADQAKEALNFHISLIIYAIIASILTLVFIGFLLYPVIGVFAAIFAIVAAIKASQGVAYRYPLTIRLVK